VTFGRWSAPTTTVVQLAAKAAQIEQPVAVTPEAVQQRMPEAIVNERRRQARVMAKQWGYTLLSPWVYAT
jgi:hypothetical protein